MNKPWRSLLVFCGLSILFAAILVLVAKPLPHVAIALPFAAVSHNIPYFFYLRAAQWIGGLNPSVVLIANSLLALCLCGFIFRVAWGISEERHRLFRATMAMLMFELNPLVIVLPLTLGFLGGYLLVPLFLLIFVSVMLSVDHWSAFMRAIVLASTWSLFLWVHLPAAIVVLVAMIPWVLYNRRPGVALGTFLTIILLGTAIFSLFWTAGCLVAQRWAMLHDPLRTLQLMWEYIRQGITSAGSEGPAIFKDRLVHLVGWLSPFFMILGLTVSGKALLNMLRQRRTASVDLIALISLVVLTVTLLSPGKDTLPGAWYLIMVAAMWAPLIAKDLAIKEYLFTRPARILFSFGFLASLGLVWTLRHNSTGTLLPDARTLIQITISVSAIGGLMHFLLRKHPLPLENRIQSYLFGSMLGYFVVIDFGLFR